MLVALLLWTSLGIWALFTGTLPPKSLASIAFFIIFFVGFCRYYWRMQYIVDDTGLTIHGHHVPWESIESVEPSSMPLVGWELNTLKGRFVLDIFIRRRALLLDVIIARAGLFRMG